MITKFYQTLLGASAMLFFCTVLHAAPQKKEILRTVLLSKSACLVVERVKEPAPPPKGTPGPLAPGAVLLDPSSRLGRTVNLTYTLIFKQGNKEVKIDRFEFLGAADFDGGLGLRGFVFYDAALSEDNLLCTFVYKRQMLMATAHVDKSGNISNYRRRELPEALKNIDETSFTKDKDGKVILNAREAGKMNRSFRFDHNGDAAAVPADEP